MTQKPTDTPAFPKVGLGTSEKHTQPVTSSPTPILTSKPTTRTEAASVNDMCSCRPEHISKMAVNFDKLSLLERRLLVLQKGAPLNSNTLPELWSNVKRKLYDEGLISLDNVSSMGATECLKALYERVRLGVEIFWSSESEPVDNRKWVPRYAEDFDVFDRREGTKYWKHDKHSELQPAQTRISAIQESEVVQGQDQQLIGDRSDSLFNAPFQSMEGGRAPTAGDLAATVETNDDQEEPPSSIDPDRTLVENMQNTSRSSGSVMEAEELERLLSPLQDFLQASHANVSPSKHFECTSNNDVVGSSDSVDDVPFEVSRTGKRKSKQEEEINVHEDSPDRIAVTHSEPFETDVPKENQQEEGSAAFPSDVDIITTTPRRSRNGRYHLMATATPRSARFTQASNIAASPIGRSIFGPVSPWRPLNEQRIWT